jgi:hypothetical protein
MSANDKTPGPVSSASQRARRLRIIAVIVLSLGLVGAGVVYWLGTRPADLSGDASMMRYNRPQEQQMQILYGKQGALIEDLSDGLKQPGTQAFLIMATSIVIAAGCFYFARLLDDDGEKPRETGLPHA